MTQSIALDPERQKQAKVYARIERRLAIIDVFFGGVYTLAWLVFGWALVLQHLLTT
ncbi:MAG: hypothetical protein PHQ40_06515 [Anaerolineaceae bacterium]|nr:hypothetical protein [Anaerolineaceae bacterium]